MVYDCISKIQRQPAEHYLLILLSNAKETARTNARDVLTQIMKTLGHQLKELSYYSLAVKRAKERGRMYNSQGSCCWNVKKESETDRASRYLQEEKQNNQLQETLRT